MRIRSFLVRILDLPLSAWVFLAFFVSYLFFFVHPVFLSTNVMQFDRYVSAAEHIGIDLKQALSFSEYWLAADLLHYSRSNNYPPIASLVFAPLLGLKFPVAFQIVSWLSVLAYGFMTLVLAPNMNPERRPSSLPAVFCFAGLLSHGLQFELERGQFNMLAMLLEPYSSHPLVMTTGSKFCRCPQLYCCWRSLATKEPARGGAFFGYPPS